MSVDTQTQAILLLTAWFGKASHEGAKPLSSTEWGRFAAWLHSQSLTPAQLLEANDPQSLLENWNDREVGHDRIKRLLARTGALGLVLEKWERAGLWVLARSHPDYPAKLKSRLGPESPPALIGCGDRALLRLPSIAVVGSRDASEEDLAFSAVFGRAAADAGYSVVSGGARGVDETAMQGALDAGGSAIGILADSLLRTATSVRFRSAIAAERLILVSPFSPDAKFNVGNAMARNKYIYCCSDVAVVVASSKGKGGTWAGAVEALQSKWVTLWVRTTPSSPEGNAALVRKGAYDLGNRIASPEELLAGRPGGSPLQSKWLFDEAERSDDNGTSRSGKIAAADGKNPTAAEAPSGAVGVVAQMSFVDFFVAKLASQANSKGMSSSEIAATFNVSNSQVSVWLKQAEEHGLIIRTKRPIRYKAVQGALPRASN